ncbi:MAG TPA: radical SAM protein [Methylothermaceae bacterium]|nr:radical SAM protein [Methylothermaceae bacterium]
MLRLNVWADPGHLGVGSSNRYSSVETNCASLSETDCACPAEVVPVGHPSFLVDPGQLWQIAPGLHHHTLSKEHVLVFSPAGRAGVIVLHQDAWQLLQAFGTPQPLSPPIGFPDAPAEVVSAALRLLVQLDLLCPTDAPPSPPQPRSRTLTVWLHVTNACNLRCTYCYIAKSNEHMEESTGRRAIRSVVQSALEQGFQRIKLKYAGGEPALRSRLIARLHSYAQTLTRHHGLELDAVVLSNGVALDEAFLAFLRAQNIRLMVSLDGMGSTHDAQRPTVGGQGSYARVIHTLEQARARGIRPHLSVTVTAQNVDTLPQVVDFALERELPMNLNFYRDYSGDASAVLLRSQEERLIQGMRGAFRAIEERLPRYRLLDGLLDRSNFVAPHDRACGMGESYLVIDHRGRVSACQMEMEQAVAHIDQGSEILLHVQRAAQPHNPPVTEREGCAECTWRFWCAGGCPLLTQRVTGRTDLRSPYCRVYKALFPELLRLEALRLLKWEKPLGMAAA